MLNATVSKTICMRFQHANISAVLIEERLKGSAFVVVFVLASKQPKNSMSIKMYFTITGQLYYSISVIFWGNVFIVMHCMNWSSSVSVVLMTVVPLQEENQDFWAGMIWLQRANWKVGFIRTQLWPCCMQEPEFHYLGTWYYDHFCLNRFYEAEHTGRKW